MNIKYIINAHNKFDFLFYNLKVLKDNFGKENLIIATSNDKLIDVCKEDYEVFDIKPDHGKHKGTVFNYLKALKSVVDKHEDVDYVAIMEEDNIFYSKEKFFNIIDEMVKNDKHVLSNKEEARFRSRKPNGICTEHSREEYICLTTINIFSKKFLTENMNYDIEKDIFGFPLENYMGVMISRHNKLITEEDVVNFWKEKSYPLDYSLDKTYFPEDKIDYHPDRFLKYGMINAFDNDFNNYIGMIERYRDVDFKQVTST